MNNRTYERVVQNRHDHDDQSEYEDDEDVPGRGPSGRKVWDYFYVHINDLRRGLKHVKVLYRREYDILFHKFERQSHRCSKFRSAPGLNYTLYMENKLYLYVKVKAKLIQDKRGSLRVQLMNIPELQQARQYLAPVDEGHPELMTYEVAMSFIGHCN